MTIQEIINNDIKQIERLATKSFSKHHIKCILDDDLVKHWKISKPDSVIYSFRITTYPGVLIIEGDIDSLILKREADMLRWAKGAINSIDYFAEKVVSEIPTRVYSADVAQSWYKEILDDEDISDKTKDKLKDYFEWADWTNEYEIMQAIYDCGIVDGCDFPTLTTYTPNFLWCREATKWFLVNYID